MTKYNWWTATKNFFSGLNREYTTVPVLPIQEYRFNEMYPYTIEHTTRVTHHNKPKRRDASRRWKNK